MAAKIAFGDPTALSLFILDEDEGWPFLTSLIFHSERVSRFYDQRWLREPIEEIWRKANGYLDFSFGFYPLQD